MNRLLIDVSHLSHSLLYSMDELSCKEGATEIIYGVLSKILHLAHTFETADLIFCWDSKSSKRKKIYPEYKQGRKDNLTQEQKEVLQRMYQQMDELRKEILPKIGFKNQLLYKGYEADDIIGYLSNSSLLNPDELFIIVSNDGDLYQCLRGREVKILKNHHIFTEKKFIEKYGITPKEWIEVKAIAGCSSDNVKGVRGIGELSAIKYLTGTMNNKTKKYKSIIAEEGQKIRARNLTLVALPFPGIEVKLQRNDFSIEGFKKICKYYELNSFLEEPLIEKWQTLLSGELKKINAKQLVALYKRKRRK